MEGSTQTQWYTAQDVADGFVRQYYYVMQFKPSEAHGFYKEESIRSHPCADGSIKTTTTMKGIGEDIVASNIKEWNPDMSSVQAQDSVMESVIVGVMGSLTDNDGVARNFVQTFVLAPQEGGGFYVHNDILQFIETPHPLTEAVASPPTDEVANPPINEVANPLTDEVEKSLIDEVANPQEAILTRGKGKLVEDGDHATADKDVTSNKCTSEKEDDNVKSQTSDWSAKKPTYASILAKEGCGSSETPKPSVFPVSSSTIDNNSHLENIYDVNRIRVKDLPQKTTKESLLQVVKQFGPCKQKNILIISQKDGYRYAFVEFDNAKSARAAVEAGFIKLGDTVCEIQKKFQNQGGSNHMGKPADGRGGYGKDNFWGRGGEGRSSGSWSHK